MIKVISAVIEAEATWVTKCDVSREHFIQGEVFTYQLFKAQYGFVGNFIHIFCNLLCLSKQIVVFLQRWIDTFVSNLFVRFVCVNPSKFNRYDAIFSYWEGVCFHQTLHKLSLCPRYLLLWRPKFIAPLSPQAATRICLHESRDKKPWCVMVFVNGCRPGRSRVFTVPEDW